MPQTRWKSCNIRAALQILQTSMRAAQNMQTAAEVHSRRLLSTQMNTRLRGLDVMCSDQTSCSEIPAKLV